MFSAGSLLSPTAQLSGRSHFDTPTYRGMTLPDSLFTPTPCKATAFEQLMALLDRGDVERQNANAAAQEGGSRPTTTTEGSHAATTAAGAAVGAGSRAQSAPGAAPRLPGQPGSARFGSGSGCGAGSSSAVAAAAASDALRASLGMTRETPRGGSARATFGEHGLESDSMLALLASPGLSQMLGGLSGPSGFGDALAGLGGPSGLHLGPGDPMMLGSRGETPCAPPLPALPLPLPLPLPGGHSGRRPGRYLDFSSAPDQVQHVKLEPQDEPLRAAQQHQLTAALQDQLHQQLTMPWPHPNGGGGGSCADGAASQPDGGATGGGGGAEGMDEGGDEDDGGGKGGKGGGALPAADTPVTDVRLPPPLAGGCSLPIPVGSSLGMSLGLAHDLMLGSGVSSLGSSDADGDEAEARRSGGGSQRSGAPTTLLPPPLPLELPPPLPMSMLAGDGLEGASSQAIDSGPAAAAAAAAVAAAAAAVAAAAGASAEAAALTPSTLQRPQRNRTTSSMLYGSVSVEPELSAGTRRGTQSSMDAAGPTSSADALPPPARAAPAAGGANRSRRNSDSAPTKSCRCKKSQCLKLYCDCFAAGVYCGACSCSSCHNRPEYADRVQAQRENIAARDPQAFTRKILDAPNGNGKHKRGCNCRRSHCLKKYCECYQGGVMCGKQCKCLECENMDPAVLTGSPEDSAGTARGRAASTAAGGRKDRGSSTGGGSRRASATGQAPGPAPVAMEPSALSQPHMEYTGGGPGMGMGSAPPHLSLCLPLPNGPADVDTAASNSQLATANGQYDGLLLNAGGGGFGGLTAGGSLPLPAGVLQFGLAGARPGPGASSAPAMAAVDPNRRGSGGGATASGGGAASRRPPLPPPRRSGRATRQRKLSDDDDTEDEESAMEAVSGSGMGSDSSDEDGGRKPKGRGAKAGARGRQQAAARARAAAAEQRRQRQAEEEAAASLPLPAPEPLPPPMAVAPDSRPMQPYGAAPAGMGAGGGSAPGATPSGSLVSELLQFATPRAVPPPPHEAPGAAGNPGAADPRDSTAAATAGGAAGSHPQSLPLPSCPSGSVGGGGGGVSMADFLPGMPSIGGGEASMADADALFTAIAGAAAAGGAPPMPGGTATAAAAAAAENLACAELLDCGLLDGLGDMFGATPRHGALLATPRTGMFGDMGLPGSPFGGVLGGLGRMSGSQLPGSAVAPPPPSTGGAVQGGAVRPARMALGSGTYNVGGVDSLDADRTASYDRLDTSDTNAAVESAGSDSRPPPPGSDPHRYGPPPTQTRGGAVTRRLSGATAAATAAASVHTLVSPIRIAAGPAGASQRVTPTKRKQPEPDTSSVQQAPPGGNTGGGGGGRGRGARASDGSGNGGGGDSKSAELMKMSALEYMQQRLGVGVGRAPPPATSSLPPPQPLDAGGAGSGLPLPLPIPAAAAAPATAAPAPTAAAPSPAPSAAPGPPQGTSKETAATQPPASAQPAAALTRHMLRPYPDQAAGPCFSGPEGRGGASSPPLELPPSAVPSAPAAPPPTVQTTAGGGGPSGALPGDGGAPPPMQAFSSPSGGASGCTVTPASAPPAAGTQPPSQTTMLRLGPMTKLGSGSIVFFSPAEKRPRIG